VGSQFAATWDGFCAAIGAARAAPSAIVTAVLLKRTFIKDLPDSLKRVEKLPIIYRPAFFVPVRNGAG